jgi:hypothetical protein
MPGPVLGRPMVIAMIISNGYIGRGVATRGLCPPGAPDTRFSAPGRGRGVTLLDKCQGIDREGRVLTYEQVHGCVE